MSMLKYRSC